MYIAIIIAAAILCACTAPNALHHDDETAGDAAPAWGDGAQGGADGDGGAADDTAVAEDGDAPASPDLELDDPAECSGPSERTTLPTCHGGTLERDATGAVVCHWDCVGHAEVTAVVVESGGCFVLDDMVCHQCTANLPRSWDPSPMPCPDVVRMLW